MGTVRLDGAHTEDEVLGDLRVGVAERDLAQHLLFTCGQIVELADLLLRGKHPNTSAADIAVYLGDRLQQGWYSPCPSCR